MSKNRFAQFFQIQSGTRAACLEWARMDKMAAMFGSVIDGTEDASPNKEEKKRERGEEKEKRVSDERRGREVPRLTLGQGDEHEVQQIEAWTRDLLRAVSNARETHSPKEKEKSGIFHRRKRSENAATTTASEVELMGIENSKRTLLELLRMRNDLARQVEEMERDVAEHTKSLKQLTGLTAKYEGFAQAYLREREKLHRQYRERCGGGGSGLPTPKSPAIEDLRAPATPGSPALVRKGDSSESVLERLKEKIAEKEQAMQTLEPQSQEYFFTEAQLLTLQLSMVNMSKLAVQKQREGAQAVAVPAMPRLVAVSAPLSAPQPAGNLPNDSVEAGGTMRRLEQALDSMIELDDADVDPRASSGSGDGGGENIDAELDAMMAGLDDL